MKSFSTKDELYDNATNLTKPPCQMQILLHIITVVHIADDLSVHFQKSKLNHFVSSLVSGL